MKRSLMALAAGIAGAALVAGCAGTGGLGESGTTYVAHLQAMNTNVTQSAATGKARIRQRGDKLKVRIKMKGTPASIEHWQHFHGFEDGAAATCPTAAADKNGDGIVDLIETEPYSGTTMVPFISDPASMDIPHGQYPVAAADGSYSYEVTLSAAQLQAAFAQQFPGRELDLDKRVIYVHGVPASTALPASVQSLGPIPASTTLPIACGVIQKVARK